MPGPLSQAERTYLLNLATTAPGGRGVSPAGRALQKHASRKVTAFSGATGNALNNTKIAKGYLEKILGDGLASIEIDAVYGRVLEVRLSNGVGAKFKANGEFIGWLEAYTPLPR